MLKIFLHVYLGWKVEESDFIQSFFFIMTWVLIENTFWDKVTFTQSVYT